MKRMLCVAVALLVVGCSENTLIVENHSGYCGFSLNFRAKTYDLPAGSGPVEVNDVPNGTYTYGSVVTHPFGTTLEMGNGLTGDLTFQSSSTQWRLIYGADITEYDSVTGEARGLEAWGVTSTTDPTSVLSVTAP